MNATPKLHNPGSTPGWQRDWVLGGLLLAVTLIAYLPVWQAGFLWDDDLLLTNNPIMRQPDGWLRFWLTTQTPDYFPLTSTSFWLEWRLWGMNATGYHVTNVLLHTLSVILLWRVLARMKLPGAWLAAAIFALHPVNVASVAWIAERKNTLALPFFLLTLLGWLKFEDQGQRRWYWLALAAFGLGLLSKTAVAPLPLVLLGLAWWRRGRVTWPDIWRSAAFFGTAGGLAMVTLWFQHHNAIGHEIVRTDDFWSRLALAGRAVWFYFGKAVWPVGLIPVYPHWPTGAVKPSSFMPGLLLVAVFALCWRQRATWGRVPLFGCGYVVVMLLPVLGFVNMYYFRYSLVADHWQYFAIIGLIALAAAALTTLLRPFPKGKLIISAALLLGLGVLTWRQATIYHDAGTFWQTTLAGNPNCAAAYDGLGCILLEDGNPNEALGYFQKAVQLDPDYPPAHYNLGRVLLQKGEPGQAVAQFQWAVQSNPDYAAARNSLGAALLLRGQLDEAIAQFQISLRMNPKNAEAHYNLGCALFRQGRVDPAITELQNSLQIKPDYALAGYELGLALLQKGETDAAIARFQNVLRRMPDFADASYNLALALLKLNRTDEAIHQFQRTLLNDPGNVDAHYNLGVLFQNGRVNEAIEQFQAALQIDPRHTQARNNLGSILLQKGDLGGAITQFQMALQTDPQDLPALNNLAWVLAVAPQPSLRNGSRAVDLARQANELAGGKVPAVLRTLAAAYAEAGEFGEAVNTTQKALDLARTLGQPALATQFSDDLQRYQTGLPLHQ